MINPAIIKAVIAALHMNAAAAWACNEVGGAIVAKPDGELIRAYAEVQEADPIHTRFQIEIPKGDKLVAIWHTHTECLPGIDDRQFSSGDIAMQHALGVPSFIFVQLDRSLRVYDGKHVSVIGMGVL